MFHKVNTSLLKLYEKPIISDDVETAISNIDIKVHVYDSDPNGDSEKEVILFIHGNSTSMNVFSRLINHFAKSHRVVALDLLGCGNSSKISDFNEIGQEEKETVSRALYNPFACITIIKQVLDGMDIHNVHIIGWSLGGHLAYAIASLYPKLVDSIIAIASPPVNFQYRHPTFREGFATFFPDMVIPNWIEKPRSFTTEDTNATALYCGFDINDKNNDVIFSHIEQSDPLMRKYLFALSECNNDEEKILDGERFVTNTSIPIILMVSSADAAINASYILQFAKRFENKNSKVVIIESDKHATFLHHELFVKEVEKFYLQG